ncbi:uncharacterized protein PG998_008544 [Apiospora kogelbergensis]|uniref:uncharacterized protein n=1 Tax=Apiospora kogelbergensis TaxID=1337665 RepID=UPI0031307DDE
MLLNDSQDYLSLNTTQRSLLSNGAQFHPFPRLPPELRQQIWLFSMEPRELHYGPPSIHRLRAPAPALLHACSESRVYLQQNHYVDAVRGTPVNLEIDTIFLYWLQGPGIQGILPRIQKMTLSLCTADDFISQCCNVLRQKMTALRELKVHSIDSCRIGQLPWWMEWTHAFEKLYHDEANEPASFYMRVIGLRHGNGLTRELTPESYSQIYRPWRFLDDWGNSPDLQREYPRPGELFQVLGL